MEPRAALRERLAEIERQGLYRRRRVLDSPQGPEVVVDGRRLINFCSNDYLGLANDPAVVAALREGAARYGVGSGAAHLVCGHGRAHHELEAELADFTGRDRALLFSTGYMANLGVVSAMTGRGDAVFEDRLNHASLVDGARLSGARLRRYAHADAAALAEVMGAGAPGAGLIASDGVFSMDGDLAPVPGLARVAREQGAWLLIDDAHGLGVLGARGGGLLEQQGLSQDEVPILVGTLGKAFGTFGAFVAGRTELIEWLVQRARTYIYTTALPPAVAVATRKALKLARLDAWRRERLNALIARFRGGACHLGLPLLDSATPIQPLLIGGNAAALRASDALLAAGFLVGAIRPPTVPAGTARLRITLTAAHTEAQVDRLLDTLARRRGRGGGSPGTGDMTAHRTPGVHVESFGAGPELVMLHGWSMHGGVWRDFAERLSAGFRVSLVDLPGHGRSGPLPEYTLATITEAVLAVAPPRAHWLGWSLGALLALGLVDRQPERAASLTLIAGSPRFTVGDDWPGVAPEQLGQVAADLEQDYAGTLKRFIALQTYGQAHARFLARHLHARIEECPAPDTGALRGGLDLLQSLDLRAALAACTAPVLAVLGAHDRLVPKAVAPALRALNAGLEAHTLPAAAHLPFLTHPDETVGLIRAFLEQQARTASR